ncbi:hypothetical protein PISMIDRAFT_114951, partial [Pisolithus microcarpus 441]
LHELILEFWRDYFRILKQDLAKALGRISFTTDIWSAENLHPYLATAAHWITNNNGPLKMRASLITFQYFPSAHTGDALAKLTLEILDRAEVTSKVCIV